MTTQNSRNEFLIGYSAADMEIHGVHISTRRIAAATNPTEGFLVSSCLGGENGLRINHQDTKTPRVLGKVIGLSNEVFGAESLNAVMYYRGPTAAGFV